MFVAEIGVGGSEILDSRELPIYFDYKIQSSFNADNTVSISLVNVVPRIEATFPELNGSPLAVITQTSKSIKAF